MTERFFLLENQVKNYDWGDTSLIPDFLGREDVSGDPVAELWMGDHPAGTSKIFIDGESRSLSDCISANPERFLGKTLVGLGYDKLPFLLKVLSAAKPLSVQCHPNLEQAMQGFTREDALGIPRNSLRRNYRDPMHKPEILCALGDFWGLCGFRAGAEIAREFNHLAEKCGKSGAALCRTLSELAGAGGMKALCSEILELGKKKETPELEEILNAAETCRDERYIFLAKARIAFPGDAGLLFFIVLELFHLTKGQAVFIPAGVLHAYLRGIGLEAMANSDNVLRGGLTPKRIDREELLLILDPDAAPILLDPGELDGIKRYDTPAREFMFSRILGLNGYRKIELGGKAGPAIILCLQGEAVAGKGTRRETMLKKGQSLIVFPGTEMVEIGLSGELCIVTVPMPSSYPVCGSP